MIKIAKAIALVLAAAIAAVTMFACSVKGGKNNTPAPEEKTAVAGSTGDPAQTQTPTPTANPAIDPALQKFVSANVGDYVTFGKYEQDNDTENGKEDIEWLVLAKEDSRLFLISRYALDRKLYNNTWVNTTWEWCTLRKWLNETFVNDAFSETAQTMILTTDVKAEDNPNNGTEGGYDTKDKIFLLSVSEANAYFSADDARRCAPTEYAKAKGVSAADTYKTDHGDAACMWWLRTPGYASNFASYVGPAGNVFAGNGSDKGAAVVYDTIGVRPALWIDYMAAAGGPGSESTADPDAGPDVSKLKAASVGDYVIIGKYEQDNSLDNGKENIEWLVLAKEGSRMLVISRYALDRKTYNNPLKEVTWEESTLRKWLNETFINNAFNANEQTMILLTDVMAEDNPIYGTEAGNDTKDKVFLLSISETNKYFAADSNKMCVATEYAKWQGVWSDERYKTDGNAVCWWWLRSPGDYSYTAAFVYSSGEIYEGGGSIDGITFSRGGHVDVEDIAVRPAMWIDISG